MKAGRAYLQFDTYDRAAEFLDELEREARTLPTVEERGYAESRLRSAPWGPLSGKARILFLCTDDKLHVFAGVIRKQAGLSVVVEVADYPALRGFAEWAFAVHRTFVRAFAVLWLSGIAIGLIVKPSLGVLVGMMMGGFFFYFVERQQRAAYRRMQASCASAHGIELLYVRYQAPVSVPRFRDAYQRLSDEIRAVPDSALLTINVDIPSAVTTALGALPEIRGLRARIVAELPSFDIARFDKIEAYTMAVAHAHSLYLAASAPTESVVALSEAAAKSRELLFSDATALAKRGLLDGQRLKELKGPNGYRNLAFDLLALAAMLRENWARISAKTAVDLTELDEGETLADRLLTALGEREQGPSSVAVSSDMRQRAFSLFVSAYDQARRAVSHLRWQERDVDTIAPSLYAGRGNTRRRQSDIEPPSATAAVPSAAPALNVPVIPASPAVPAVAPGLPGSDPFVQA